jgi:hypothetical protein
MTNFSDTHQVDGRQRYRKMGLRKVARIGSQPCFAGPWPLKPNTLFGRVWDEQMDSINWKKPDQPSKRRGRPVAESPRVLVIKVRATPNESVIIRGAADAARMPVATFLRSRALNTSNPPIPRADIEAAAQLARIGNVFHQAVQFRDDGPGWPWDELEQLRDLCNKLSVSLTQKAVVTTGEEELE